MAMPTGGAWPPKPFNEFYDQVAAAHAWWSGEVIEQRAAWQPAPHPAQFQGGIKGAASRAWLGKPRGVGEAADKLHIPLPADICHLSAITLFDEPPVVGLSADEDNPKAQARIDELVNTQDHASQLLVASEVQAAQGGTWGRVVWDQDLQPEPWIDYVHYNRAIPEFKYGRLVAVTFWQELKALNDKYVHRHLERYSPGWVEHALFEGKRDDLGRVVPLEDHPATAGLAGIVNSDSAVPTGGRMLAAWHIPNNGLNIPFVDRGDLRHLGASDLSPQLFPIFDKINMTYTSLMRDIRLGRARIVASEQLLDDHGPGRGQSFDLDREVFTSVSQPPTAENPLLESFQFEIRVEQHLATTQELTIMALRRAGYSPLSFGLDTAGVAETATEIKAKSRHTTSTSKAKGRYWSTGIAYGTAALLEVDAALNNTGITLAHLPTVEIQPPVQETELDRAATIQALDTARAVSTDTKVRMVNPDWEESRVKQEVGNILKEQSIDYDPFAVEDAAAHLDQLNRTEGVPDAVES